jgi:hypothetical protein
MSAQRADSLDTRHAPVHNCGEPGTVLRSVRGREAKA